MAYLDVNEAYTMEVRVRALSGQSFQFHIDQFAIIGDVKQRLSNGLARKFHEMKLLYNSEEPGVFEKVGKFRNRSGNCGAHLGDQPHLSLVQLADQ